MPRLYYHPDYIGKKFGKWTVLEYIPHLKTPCWKCACECGTIRNVIISSLIKGDSTQCKKCHIKQLGDKKLQDFTGKRFGKYLVLRYLGQSPSGSTWECQCDCGAIVNVSRSNLKKGGGSFGCRKCANKSKLSKFLEAAKESAKNRKIGIDNAALNIIFAQIRRGAKKRDLQFHLTKEQVGFLIKKPCFYCGSLYSNEKKINSYNESFFYNGIDRVDNRSGYDWNNCVPCCYACNNKKLATTISIAKKMLTWFTDGRPHWLEMPK